MNNPSPSSFIPRKEVDASYRPKGYGTSPGLERARAPFRLRNALTGVAIAGFAVGVWAYSIRAVKQDSFEDVDEEAKALVQSRKTAAAAALQAHLPPIQEYPRRGLLPQLIPRHMDPTTNTFIWGAPSIDAMGRMGDRKSS